jgi:rieske iron-sulfur protein
MTALGPFASILACARHVAYPPSTLVGVTQERAAEGVVACSAICPHAGCEVSVWVAEQKIFECSCQHSRIGIVPT